MRVGLVADTHGLWDPGLERVLRGCALVLHAGDVGRATVLESLSRVAPVRAVRGNNDDGPLGESLPASLRVELGVLRALLVHEADPARPTAELLRLLAAERPDLVIHGHSHRPGAALREGTLFLDPGSAGPRRFTLPRTACVVELEGRRVQARWWDLASGPGAPFGDPFEADL